MTTQDDNNTSPQLAWSSSTYSHVGMVRKVNEDACTGMPLLGEGGLWAVADGMGGHEAGDVASQMIIDTLQQVPPPNDMADFIRQAETAVQRANRLIQEKAARDYQHRTIGSTVVVLLLYGSEAACLWAGDSRIYRLRNNRLELLTRDHSHVQEMLDRGLISAEEADRHPLSNVITRAVGSTEHLEVDKISFTAQAGDVYLLCSDGLTKAVSDYEIAQLLATSQTRHAVNGLINAALRRQADDNVTAAVVTVSRSEQDPGAETVPIEQLKP